MDSAVRSWARDAVGRHPEMIRLGYFGSYARGDWGVRSDIALIKIVDHTDVASEDRSLEWDLAELPVAAQLLIYTSSQWEALLREGRRFARTLERETVWAFERVVSERTSAQT